MQLHQLLAKMTLHQELPYIKGTVLWYAKAAVDNIGNYGTSLRNVYWKTPALQPLMPNVKSKTPGKVRKVKVMDFDGQKVLFWTPPKSKSWDTEALKYVVYRFDGNETINTEDPTKMVAVTTETLYEIPQTDGTGNSVYVVTPLNRIDGEGKAVKKKIKY